MSTIRAVQYEPFHSYEINLREQDKLSTAELNHDPELCATGPAITLIAEEIIACIGYLSQNGVGNMWMLTSPLIEKYKFWMYRNMKYVLDELVMKQDIHRLQAVVRASNEPAHRWIQHLGFEKEGVLKKFTPDPDYVLYARLNDG